MAKKQRRTYIEIGSAKPVPKEAKIFFSTAAREEIARAIEDAAECCKVHPEVLMSRNREERTAIARFFLYTILRNAGYGWAEIGRATERDHGAAICGVRRLEMRMRCNERGLALMRDKLVDKGWDLNNIETEVTA